MYTSNTDVSNFYLKFKICAINKSVTFISGEIFKQQYSISSVKYVKNSMSILFSFYCEQRCCTCFTSAKISRKFSKKYLPTEKVSLTRKAAVKVNFHNFPRIIYSSQWMKQAASTECSPDCEMANIYCIVLWRSKIRYLTKYAWMNGYRQAFEIKVG